MDLTLTDTIVALATARRPGPRGVLRMTGPETLDCLRRCFRGDDRWHRSRAARCWAGTLELPDTSATFASSARDIETPRPVAPGLGTTPRQLPGVLYWWPGCSSYTRQPSAEFHTLGSLPLLEAAMARLVQCGARLARPGEFTFRAWLAGRIDLTQAEAVLAVIDARSNHELEVALEQLAGGMAEPLQALRHQLLDLLADLEAGLDFVDEDIEFISADELAARLGAARDDVWRVARRLDQRQVDQSDATVVLYGRPNVGKSTLWSQLGGGRALVSDQPGTTRDYLVARVHWDAVPVLLIDTAGIDHASALDDVGRRALGLARQVTSRGQVKLLCLDATRPLDDWELAELQRPDPNRLVVLNKTDRVEVDRWLEQTSILTSLDVTPDLAVSGLDATNLAAIGPAVARLLRGTGELEPAGAVASTAARCRDDLRRAAQRLVEASQWAEHRAGDELVAAAVRAALDELSQVAGAVHTDELLDRVFSRFCIGK